MSFGQSQENDNLYIDIHKKNPYTCTEASSKGTCRKDDNKN